MRMRSTKETRTKGEHHEEDQKNDDSRHQAI